MAFRYRLTVAYDGTAFAGWQVQPRLRTVQGELEALLAEMTAVESVRVEASGRTDAGVHARGQVVHVDLPKRVNTVYFKRGLNAQLSGELRVLGVQRVAADFHARFDAVSKEYRYFIYNGMVVPPSLRLYRLQEGRRLNVVRMQAAADRLVGEHDFAAFAAKRGDGSENTVRRLMTLRVVRRGAEVVVVARSNGFLYKMVRSLTGFLMGVGMGQIEPDEVPLMLEQGERTARIQTARPHGLFLWQVSY